mgnify:CR=1 FL=1
MLHSKEMAESSEYAPIIRYLELRGYKATRVQSGGYRGRMRHSAAGWPDIVACSPTGEFVPVEVKRRGEKLRPEQSEFQAWCCARAIAYYVVTGAADLADQMEPR